MANPNPSPHNKGANPETNTSFPNARKCMGTVGQYWGAMKDMLCSFNDFLVARNFQSGVQGLKASLTYLSANSQVVGILNGWKTTSNDAPPMLRANTWAVALKKINRAAIVEKRALVGEVNTLGKALSPTFDLMTLGSDGKGLDALVVAFNTKLCGENPKTAKAMKTEFVEETMPKLADTLEKLYHFEVGVALKAKAAAEAGEQVIEAAKKVVSQSSYATKPYVRDFCDYRLKQLGKAFSDRLEDCAGDPAKSPADFMEDVKNVGSSISSKIEKLLKEAEDFAEVVTKGNDAQVAIHKMQHNLTNPIHTPSKKPEILKDVVYVKISNDMADLCNEWLEKQAQTDLDAFAQVSAKIDYSKTDDIIEKAKKLAATSEHVHKTLYKVAETLIPVSEVWDPKKAGDRENDMTFGDLILCRMDTDAQRDEIRPHVTSYFDLVKTELERQVRKALHVDIHMTTPSTRALVDDIDEIRKSFVKFVEKPGEFMKDGREADAEVGFRYFSELFTEKFNLDPAGTARRQKEADVRKKVDDLMD